MWLASRSPLKVVGNAFSLGSDQITFEVEVTVDVALVEAGSEVSEEVVVNEVFLANAQVRVTCDEWH